MVLTDLEQDHHWASQQIEAYRTVYPRYARMSQVLQQVLEKACKQISSTGYFANPPQSHPQFCRESHPQEESWTLQRSAGTHD